MCSPYIEKVLTFVNKNLDGIGELCLCRPDIRLVATPAERPKERERRR
jgi:hypothetical protein